jgi:rare lipoprotein A
MRNRTLVIVLAAVVAWGGCARRKKPRAPVPARAGHAETGVASWYGEPYHGRRAANGEIYDMEKLTAAHRTLAFGTWVRVGNLANGKSVVVRITDRGPFVGGRIIDLSRAAARAIDMIGPGTAKVRVTLARAPEKIPEAELFAVQAGAFRERSRADQLRRRMEARHQTARLVRREGSPPMWRVLVGRESTIEAAERLAERLRPETGAAFVVRLDEIQP